MQVFLSRWRRGRRRGRESIVVGVVCVRRRRREGRVVLRGAPDAKRPRLSATWKGKVMQWREIDLNTRGTPAWFLLGRRGVHVASRRGFYSAGGALVAEDVEDGDR